MTNNKDKDKRTGLKKEIVKTWLSGHHSCTMIIPQDIAKEYGLDKPSFVVLEARPEGILLKKVDI